MKCPKCGSDLNGRYVNISLRGLSGEAKGYCTSCGSDFAIPLPSLEVEKIARDFWKDPLDTKKSSQ